jgi:hypothetical protein
MNRIGTLTLLLAIPSGLAIDGSVLVADETGAVQDARPIEFGRGPCFWEVRADSAWSLAPTS